MLKVNKIYDYLIAKFPLDAAMPFDQGKLGLQIGSLHADVQAVLLVLDVSSLTIKEAIKRGANLIISHHPFIFNPILKINYDDFEGRNIKEIIKHNLNIINLHTNLDIGADGMNDYLASLLGLNDIKSHGEDYLLLRTGLIEPIPLDQLVTRVQEAFKQEHVRVVGDLKTKVKKVGIVGGSGTSELKEALKANCDVLITGEIKHAHALEAQASGLNLIEISHSVEALYLNKLKEELELKFPSISFYLSEVDPNPFQII